MIKTLVLLLAFASASFAVTPFTYYKPVTVDHTKVSNSDQTNFPVYVIITDAALKSVANGGHVVSSTGTDIQFFQDAALLLAYPFELISYDPVAGKLAAAVTVGTLSHTVDTVMYIGYGAASVTVSGSDPANTWAGYIGVYHMEDASGTSLMNSSTTGPQSSTSVRNFSAMTGTGKVGNALTFNGTSDAIDLGTYTSMDNVNDNFTWSAWVKFTSVANYMHVYDKETSGGSGEELSTSGSFQSPANANDWQDSVRTTNANDNNTTNHPIALSTWYYITTVWTPFSTQLYVNGVLTAMAGSGSPSSTPNTGAHLYLGSATGGTANFLNGQIDEVRFIRRNTGVDWIVTEYTNQNSPSTFVTVGSEGTTAAPACTALTSATPFSVTSINTTPTQAVLQFTSPDANPTAVYISESPNVTPGTCVLANLAHDVDPVLFPGSNLDSRSSSVNLGLWRMFVAGYRGVGDGSDGNVYSRALAAYTLYYYQIWSQDATKLAQGTFSTQNIPLGNSAPDPPQWDAGGFGNWGWPTINWQDKTVKYVDPLTGAELTRLSGPGETGGNISYNNIQKSIGTNTNGWTNPNNVLGNADSVYATYSGAGGSGNFLFVWPRLNLTMPGFYLVQYGGMDDLRLNVTGFGNQALAADRTMQACISYDAGSTCLGTPISIVLPQTTAGNVSVPSNWPTPFFQGWGTPEITLDMLSNNAAGSIAAVTATGSGSTVTWGANATITNATAYFPVTVLKAGMKMAIAGTQPTCPANVCTLANPPTTDEKHANITQIISGWTGQVTTTTTAIAGSATTTFTVASVAGFLPPIYGVYYPQVEGDNATCYTLTGNVFSGCSGFNVAHASGAVVQSTGYNFPNFGVKLWKNTATGSVSIDTINTDQAASTDLYTSLQGSDSPYCSSATVTVSYAADGITPIIPVIGRTCLFKIPGEVQYLYLLIPSTNEARFLSPLPNLQVSFGSTPNDFNLYDNGLDKLRTCTYNAADAINGRYRSYPLYQEATLNPAFGCVDMVTNTIHSIIGTVAPQLDLSYYNMEGLLLKSISPSWGIFAVRAAEGGLAWFCHISVANPLTASTCHNDFGVYPARWLGSHGSSYQAYTDPVSGDAWAIVSGQSGLGAAGAYGIENWTVDINTIYNNGGSTALTAGFADPSSCATLGVVNPWLAIASAVATGPSCIKVNFQNEPVAKGPNAGDLKPFTGSQAGARPGPWNHNAASGCPNSGNGDGTTANCWSFLQNMAEGDLFTDPNSSFELFLLAKKTVLGNGTIDAVLARGLNPFNCKSDLSGDVIQRFNTNRAHSSGFNLAMSPPNGCGTADIFYKMSDPTQIRPDNPQLYVGHTVQWFRPDNIGRQMVPYSRGVPNEYGGSGYGIRLLDWSTFVGAGFNLAANDMMPFARDASGITTGFMQSHPGGITVDAPVSESFWAVDGRPLGRDQGGTTDLWCQTSVLVAGHTLTYKVGLPNDGARDQYNQVIDGCSYGLLGASGWNAILSRKKRSVIAFAGNRLLKDLSGPGSAISDATPFSFCIADFAGECISGSSAGDQFMSLPSAQLGPGTVTGANPTGRQNGMCIADMNMYTPCIATMPVIAGGYTQHAIDQNDAPGMRWRMLTYAFNGPSRTSNYANIHPLRTVDDMIVQCQFCDGVRSAIFAMKLPPFPAGDSVNRTDFIPVPVKLGGITGSSVRVRFGYDQRLYCSYRPEQCSTAVANSDPYSWLSETQAWTSCAAACTVNIPSIAARVLYYIVDRKDGAGNIVSGQLRIQAVN